MSELEYTDKKIYDLENEMKLLSTIFFDNNSIEEVITELTPNDFYDPRNKEIFKLLMELYKTEKIFDPELFLSFAKQKDKLNQIGREEYFSEVLSVEYTNVKIEDYIKWLKEFSIKRDLIKVSEEVISKTRKGHDMSSDIIDYLEGQINLVNNRKGINNVITLTTLVKNFTNSLNSNSLALETVSSGYSDFDNVALGGFHNSDLIILAARPGMGKTAFALNMVLNASKNKKNVLVFSLEMAAEQLLERLISMESQIPLSKIRSRNFTSSELSNLINAANNVSDLPIHIANVHKASILDIKIMARKLKRENMLDMIVIDYLQLIDTDINSNKNREQQVSEISRSLKILAKELNVPVLSLAQLSRGVESRTEKKPMLSDIRESGSIEQDADLVMFMYRENYYGDKESEASRRITEILIRKHRHGQQGVVYLEFYPEYQRFTNAKRETIDMYIAETEVRGKKKSKIE